MKAKGLAKKVGRNIARQRKRLGWTQAKVAAFLNVETETISRLETGTISPTLERLEQFSVAFECPVSIFFTDDSVNSTALANHLVELMEPLTTEERLWVAEFMEASIKLFRAGKSFGQGRPLSLDKVLERREATDHRNGSPNQNETLALLQPSAEQREN